MRAFRWMATAALVLALIAIPATAMAQATEDADTATFGFVAPTPGAPIAPVASAVLFDNGPLVTSTGTGAGGADESVLQSTSLGMNTLGFGHQAGADNRVADDFTLPEECQVDTITFYAYQTGSSTTSTMTAMNLRIFDAAPPAGAVVFGDTTTNVLASTAWINAYRVSETTGGGTLRPLMGDIATVGTSLPAGTYWADWQTDGSLGSGPWAPPVTIVGTATTGDGLQSVDGGTTYNPAADTGTGAPIQGFPFIVEGECGGTPAVEIPTLSQWGLIAFVLALVGIGLVMVARRRIA